MISLWTSFSASCPHRFRLRPSIPLSEPIPITQELFRFSINYFPWYTLPLMHAAMQLVVEQGPDKGRTITVPPQGVRVGRSSRNDVVLTDPSLSRHHCRLFLKTGDGLWIADLGSSNATLVNGQTVQEARLHKGDCVILGDTVLRVEEDGRVPTSSSEQASLPASEVKPLFDRASASAPCRRRMVPLLLVAVLCVLAAVVVWFPKLSRSPSQSIAPILSARPSPEPIEIAYEKVQADARNIFRYELHMNEHGVLSVRIDDPVNQRHVRKEKSVDRTYLAQLGRQIEETGFFGLAETYEGIQPDVLERWDLSVTLGRRTHRTRVVNRIEPDAFRAARELVEAFGKNELGLWAVQFSPERLIEMARDAFLLGRKLFDEKEIKHGNLAAALQSFQESEWYLETVEPKPEFYAELIASRNQSREALEEKYNERSFRADRAIRLREWGKAAEELRVLLELIPDRTDPRHQEARKKLLDVEARLRGRR